MNNMFGEATDPMPYIWASYFLGFLFIFGYSIWLYRGRRRVESYLNALKRTNSK